MGSTSLRLTDVTPSAPPSAFVISDRRAIISSMLGPDTAGMSNGGGARIGPARSGGRAEGAWLYPGVVAPPPRIPADPASVVTPARAVNLPPSLDPDALLAVLEAGEPPPHRVVDFVQLRPASVRLHPKWQTVLAPAMVGPFLDIRWLSAGALDQLTDQALVELLDSIANQKTDIFFITRTSKWWRKIWRDHREVSAVSALVLHLYVCDHQDLVRRILLLRPIEIARELHEVVPNLFTLDTVAALLRSMVPELTQNSIDWAEKVEANAMGNIIQAFLIVHAHARPELIEAWLTALLIKMERAGFEVTTENLGALAGAVFAGGLKYAAWIKSNDEAEFYVIDKTSQIGLALGQMVYMVPALPAILSVAAVVAGIVLEKLKPIRDFHESVIQLEGQLRIRLLKAQIFQYEYELDKFLGWIDAVKRCNGVI